MCRPLQSAVSRWTRCTRRTRPTHKISCDRKYRKFLQNFYLAQHTCTVYILKIDKLARHKEPLRHRLDTVIAPARWMGSMLHTDLVQSVLRQAVQCLACTSVARIDHSFSSWLLAKVRPQDYNEFGFHSVDWFDCSLFLRWKSKREVPLLAVFDPVRFLLVCISTISGTLNF
jgi:hypothetical protein